LKQNELLLGKNLPQLERSLQVRREANAQSESSTQNRGNGVLGRCLVVDDEHAPKAAGMKRISNVERSHRHSPRSPFAQTKREQIGSNCLCTCFPLRNPPIA